MPTPPKPNAIRALIGFPLGVVLTSFLVAFVAHFGFGMDAYFVPVKLMEGLFAGWFWDNEISLMFALFGGGIGFLWGSGAFYDFKKAPATPPVVKRQRIPLDPDAPRDPGRNPIAPLLEAVPAMAKAGAVLVGTVLVVGFIIALGGIPLFAEATVQTTNPEAERSDFGRSDFNLLELIVVEDTPQEVLFLVFSLVVLGGIVSIGGALALGSYLLTRNVAVASTMDKNPLEGNKFLPIRIIIFINDWILDILNGIRRAVTPR